MIVIVIGSSASIVLLSLSSMSAHVSMTSSSSVLVWFVGCIGLLSSFRLEVLLLRLLSCLVF